MVFGLQREASPPVIVPPSASSVVQRVPAVQAKAEPRAVTRVATKAPAKESAQVAKRAPTEDGESAANEIDPPPELLDRPDLFINYPMVRKLDELQHLESVLADPSDEGGAG
jgi:hypothetical protein